MKERYKTKSAVFLLILEKDKILLQKWKNTGFMDGFYDLAVSGHVEAGEPITQAVLREAREECNLELKPEELRLFTVIHNRLDGEVYYYFYFTADLSQENKDRLGIKEKDKIEELAWFDLKNMPRRVAEHNRVAIENYKSGTPLSELGW